MPWSAKMNWPQKNLQRQHSHSNPNPNLGTAKKRRPSTKRWCSAIATEAFYPIGRRKQFVRVAP